MAGFASFGMPIGNDNSAAAKKARKEGLARIALAKKSGYKGGDIIGGKSGPIMESTSVGDFVNRLARNYTVDVGDATSRTIQDTFLGGKGKSNMLNYSLVKPDTGFGLLDAAIKYNPTNLLAGNLLNNSDFSQMLAPGDIIPVEKAASLGLKGAKIAAPSILKGVKGAAARTSPDVLSAASGGLLRGSPIRAARSTPEPSEFDKIINAAKAEDPTLGNVVPEGIDPPVFRSELDWDESMSVNYDKAVKKISDDLLMRQRGALGEDPTIINPLIDDSIAALDSEIGNLMGRNYNHNDLEDFLGKIAAPDDYTVADATLAKRADDFISEIDTESVLWSADPEAWLLDTQFNMDAAAKAAVKKDNKDVLRQNIDYSRQGPEDFLSNPGGPAPSSNNLAAPRGKFEGMPKDPLMGDYLLAPSEQRNLSGSTLVGVVKDIEYVKTLDTGKASRPAMRSVPNKMTDRYGPSGDLNFSKTLRGYMQHFYENNPKIENLSVTNKDLYNSDDFLHGGHDLDKPFGKIRGTEENPKPPTHWVWKDLNEVAERLVAAEKRGDIILGPLKGQDYTPIIKFLIQNPNHKSSKVFFTRNPLFKNYKTVEEFADNGFANHLIGDVAKKQDIVKRNYNIENSIKKYLIKTYGKKDPITKDPDVVEWMKEARIAGNAEKVSDPSTWTTAQRAAYDAGDWRTFSSLRGYTPEEIAQFEKYMMLSERIAKKYEQDGKSIFDPDLEEFLKTL